MYARYIAFTIKQMVEVLLWCMIKISVSYSLKFCLILFLFLFLQICVCMHEESGSNIHINLVELYVCCFYQQKQQQHIGSNYRLTNI